MQHNIQCLALRTVRLNDSRNLLSVWAAGLGRVTFALPAGVSRESRRRRALTQPMVLFEAVADIRPGRDIHTMKELSPMPGSPVMTLSPIRMAVASLIAEALDLLLRRSSVDDAMTDFLFDSAVFFGEAEDQAAGNFTLSFLYHLMYYLGIAPDVDEYRPGRYFDLKEGRFTTSLPMHADILTAEDTRAAVVLARVPLRRSGLIKMPRFERRRALDLLLHYYSLHLLSLDGLKSLTVLRQIFD